MAEGERAKIVLKRGQAGARDLQPIVDEALAEAHARGEFTEVEGVEIEEKGAGAEPISTLIIAAAVGGAAANVLNKAWDDVVWPHIKKRLGVDAVGDKQEED